MNRKDLVTKRSTLSDPDPAGHTNRGGLELSPELFAGVDAVVAGDGGNDRCCFADEVVVLPSSTRQFVVRVHPGSWVLFDGMRG